MVTVAGWGVTEQVDKETVITPDMVPSEPYEVDLTVLPTLACDLYTDQPSIIHVCWPHTTRERDVHSKLMILLLTCVMPNSYIFRATVAAL